MTNVLFQPSLLAQSFQQSGAQSWLADILPGLFSDGSQTALSQTTIPFGEEPAVGLAQRKLTHAPLVRAPLSVRAYEALTQVLQPSFVRSTSVPIQPEIRTSSSAITEQGPGLFLRAVSVVKKLPALVQTAAVRTTVGASLLLSRVAHAAEITENPYEVKDLSPFLQQEPTLIQTPGSAETATPVAEQAQPLLEHVGEILQQGVVDTFNLVTAHPLLFGGVAAVFAGGFVVVAAKIIFSKPKRSQRVQEEHLNEPGPSPEMQAAIASRATVSPVAIDIAQPTRAVRIQRLQAIAQTVRHDLSQDDKWGTRAVVKFMTRKGRKQKFISLVPEDKRERVSALLDFLNPDDLIFANPQQLSFSQRKSSLETLRGVINELSVITSHFGDSEGGQGQGQEKSEQDLRDEIGIKIFVQNLSERINRAEKKIKAQQYLLRVLNDKLRELNIDFSSPITTNQLEKIFLFAISYMEKRLGDADLLFRELGEKDIEIFNLVRRVLDDVDPADEATAELLEQVSHDLIRMRNFSFGSHRLNRDLEKRDGGMILSDRVLTIPTSINSVASFLEKRKVTLAAALNPDFAGEFIALLQPVDQSPVKALQTLLMEVCLNPDCQDAQKIEAAYCALTHMYKALVYIRDNEFVASSGQADRAAERALVELQELINMTIPVLQAYLVTRTTRTGMESASVAADIVPVKSFASLMPMSDLPLDTLSQDALWSEVFRLGSITQNVLSSADIEVKIFQRVLSSIDSLIKEDPSSYHSVSQWQARVEQLKFNLRHFIDQLDTIRPLIPEGLLHELHLARARACAVEMLTRAQKADIYLRLFTRLNAFEVAFNRVEKTDVLARSQNQFVQFKTALRELADFLQRKIVSEGSIVAHELDPALVQKIMDLGALLIRIGTKKHMTQLMTRLAQSFHLLADLVKEDVDLPDFEASPAAPAALGEGLDVTIEAPIPGLE